MILIVSNDYNQLIVLLIKIEWRVEEQAYLYTLNSGVSHLTTKVHVILQSFVVLTWMRDTIELV